MGAQRSPVEVEGGLRTGPPLHRGVWGGGQHHVGGEDWLVGLLDDVRHLRAGIWHGLLSDLARTVTSTVTGSAPALRADMESSSAGRVRGRSLAGEWGLPRGLRAWLDRREFGVDTAVTSRVLCGYLHARQDLRMGTGRWSRLGRAREGPDRRRGCAALLGSCWLLLAVLGWLLGGRVSVPSVPVRCRLLARPYRRRRHRLNGSGQRPPRSAGSGFDPLGAHMSTASSPPHRCASAPRGRAPDLRGRPPPAAWH